MAKVNQVPPYPIPPYLKKKRRKGHGLLIFFIILLSVILLPIILVFAFFYDSVHVEVPFREGITTNEIFSESVNKTFDYVNEDEGTSHKLRFIISKNQLNELFKIASAGMDAKVKEFLPCFYVDIDDVNNRYDFTLEAKAAFFKTRAHLYTTLENESDNAQFKFKINSIILGRLPVDFIARNLIPNLVQPSMIEDVFKKAGLSLKVDLKTLEMTYKYDDMVNDISNMVGGSEQMKLFSGLFAGMIRRPDIFTLDSYANAQTSWNFDLVKLHTNEKYCDDDYLIDLKLDENRSKIVEMVNDSIVGAEFSDKVMTYLIRGYSDSSSDIKSYISSLPDLSKYNIPDKENYTPLVDIHHTTEEAIETIVPASIEKTIKEKGKQIFEQGGELLRLSESEMNKILKGTAPIGKTFIFAYKYQEGGVTKNKINYITIESMYVNVVKGNMAVVLGLSVNGYPVSFIIPTTKSASIIPFGIKLEYKKEDFRLGDMEVGEGVGEFIDNYLTQAVSSCGSWIKIDGTNHTISLDFDNLIPSLIKEEIQKRGDALNFSLVGENPKDAGYVKVDIIVPPTP